jgi:hypothetical protein
MAHETQNLVTHQQIPVVYRAADTGAPVWLYLRRVPAGSGRQFTRAELAAMTDDQLDNEIISQHLFDDVGRRVPASIIERWPNEFREGLLARIRPRFAPPLGITRAYRG